MSIVVKNDIFFLLSPILICALIVVRHIQFIISCLGWHVGKCHLIPNIHVIAVISQLAGVVRTNYCCSVTERTENAF